MKKKVSPVVTVIVILVVVVIVALLWNHFSAGTRGSYEDLRARRLSGQAIPPEQRDPEAGKAAAEAAAAEGRAARRAWEEERAKAGLAVPETGERARQPEPEDD